MFGAQGLSAEHAPCCCPLQEALDKVREQIAAEEGEDGGSKKKKKDKKKKRDAEEEEAEEEVGGTLAGCTAAGVLILEALYAAHCLPACWCTQSCSAVPAAMRHLWLTCPRCAIMPSHSASA